MSSSLIQNRAVSGLATGQLKRAGPNQNVHAERSFQLQKRCIGRCILRSPSKDLTLRSQVFAAGFVLIGQQR